MMSSLNVVNRRFIEFKGAFEKQYRETGHVEVRNSRIKELSKSSLKISITKWVLNNPSFFVDSAHERSRDINLFFSRL